MATKMNNLYNRITGTYNGKKLVMECGNKTAVIAVGGRYKVLDKDCELVEIMNYLKKIGVKDLKVNLVKSF
ncbi:MAG: hypothetical protein ACRCZ0_10960 [Cetobacterium sp.]